MKLAHVSFVHPIPIPGTHIRAADFSMLDGWQLEDDDGRISLRRGDVRFHTYVSASCVVAPEEKPAPMVTHPVTTRAINEPSLEKQRAHAASMVDVNQARLQAAYSHVPKRKR